MNRYHGLVSFSNETIVGPSVSDNPDIVTNRDYSKIRKENLEYKFVNKILFNTNRLKVIVYIIPYIVNKNIENCYKYECTILFYNYEEKLINCISTNDFFIYEECVNEFIQCFTEDNSFSKYFYSSYPAAVGENGTVIPFVLGIDEFNKKNEIDFSISNLEMLSDSMNKLGRNKQGE